MTFEQAWNVVFGERTEGQVVAEFGLNASPDLEEWVRSAMVRGCLGAAELVAVEQAAPDERDALIDGLSAHHRAIVAALLAASGSGSGSGSGYP